MGGEHGAKLMTATKSLQNARREELHGQLHKLEAAVRGIGRWLQDEGVSSVNSRCHLPPRQDERVVPGHQATCHSNGHISNGGGLLLVVLDDFFFQLQCRRNSDHSQRTVELILSNGVRFALLSDEKVDKVLPVGLQGIGIRLKALTAILVAGLGPGLESFLCGRYGIVEVLLSGNWAFWIRFCGGRVQTVTGFFGGS